MSDLAYRSANQFDRTQYNEAKSGYYPTLPSACQDLGRLFNFQGKQRVLEPCAGEGTAVLAVTNKRNNPELELFGVELNEERARVCKDTGLFNHVLCADFLVETFISNSAFSFIFCNPPYGNESGLESGGLCDRLEKKFLDKVKKYLVKDGIIAWIVPSYVFLENSFCASWMHAFDTIGVYKFPEPEYSRFKQLAVIARKRPNAKAVLSEEREAFQKKYALENLSWLTGEEEQILVPEAPQLSRFEFRKLQFDWESALAYDREHPQEDATLKKAILQKCGGKNGNSRQQYFPPRRVSKQNLALLTACGVGSGYAGTVEEADLHLQRGSVNRKVEYTLQVDPKSGEKTLIEKQSSSTEIILVEQSGAVTNLCKDKEEE